MKTESKTKKHDINALEALYSEADSCDQDLFSEMRSNLLLISGEHYTKKSSKFYRRIQDSKELSDQQKLRLTKNHTGNIIRKYANNVVCLLPGVGYEPKNQSELQDQKAAELHHAVWQDAKDRYNLDERNDEWCDDFFGIGEVATKIFWDPNAGDLQGFHQATDELGQPMVDEMGQMVPDKENPKYSGAFVFEELQGYNLLRSPDAKAMKSSPYLITRKMAQIDELKNRFKDDEAKLKMIQADSDQTYLIFDASRGGYRKSNKEVLVKEYFFRPCPQYPMGYFYITTTAGILAEGELPGGVFPIVWQYCERLPSAPRGRSPVKTMRPYQAEINRAASKIAEHQITLGDDKLLIQNGTKISAGVALPGVRSINFTGMEPGILNGRDGSQYTAYMVGQIEELYKVMGVADDDVQITGQIDPNALLFVAASKKKRFNRYMKRFERYLIEIAKVHSRLAKIHLPDDAVVYAVGRNEKVNIAEFRNATDISCQIKITAQADDIETKMGQQMVLNYILQYVGPKMEKDDIGKLIKAMPYANVDESFNDFTLNYDSATNVILALDRGQKPQIHEEDDHPYMIKRLVARTRQPDFSSLPPQVQQAYQAQKQQHQMIQAQIVKNLQMAESGFIPTGGYMVVCDLYVGDAKDPTKTKRARIPYESIAWLIEKLETQGQSLEELESMNQGALAQMAQMMGPGPNGSPPPNGMGGAPNSGAGMPAGALSHGRPQPRPNVNFANASTGNSVSPVGTGPNNRPVRFA